MRISALPRALEALGADLESWQGRSALQLAHTWAACGGDATVDIFEFAQAAKELEQVKPPPPGRAMSPRQNSVQGARSWRYGSPFGDGHSLVKPDISVHAPSRARCFRQ